MNNQTHNKEVEGEIKRRYPIIITSETVYGQTSEEYQFFLERMVERDRIAEARGREEAADLLEDAIKDAFELGQKSVTEKIREFVKTQKNK